MQLWLQFMVSATAVIAAGIILARSAQTLARFTRLGGLWVGAVLLAGASSLPELVTSISSGLIRVPDIGAGNLFGSSTLNILLIAVLDLFDGRKSILRKVAVDHVLSASLAMALTAAAALAVLARVGIGIAGVGIDTILIFALYVFGLLLMSRFARRNSKDQPEPPAFARPNLLLVYAGFALAALVVTGAGVALVSSADQIASVTGLGTTFIGSTLVALVTSLPELVIGTTLVLRGSLDIAIGNILGSNLMNMGLLLVVDMAYRPGPVMAVLSPTHALTGLAGVILISIATIGLVYRSERNYAGLGPDSVFIVAVYAIVAYLLFQAG